MRERIITGILFGVIVIGLMIGHDYSRLVLLGLIPLLAAYEYLQMTGAKIVNFIIFLALLVTLYFFLPSAYQSYVLYLIIAINTLLAINLFAKVPFIKHAPLRLFWSTFYIGMPFIIALQSLWYIHKHQLISMMILIWIADSGAYFVGSQIGKRKLFPRISPNKTWEGFLGGGMLTCLAAYFIFSLNGNFDISFAILFGIIVWIAGTIGDLIASQVKRLHGKKDSGTLLPGHGGFYDRFDSFVFALPFILVLKEIYL